ncbi:MAG: N-6 DNA methylase [Methylococcales bacterium]|nr:N-6 DNA methylase [Methylococcales bacterium]
MPDCQAKPDLQYSRTELANIAREFNKIFPMPVLLLIKHGDRLTLAIVHRRLNKQNADKDVLEKVTLIKDISIENTHRAHIEILHDLSLAKLRDTHHFTNFVELHKAWQKTLDTNALNKRFYKELSNWYFWASKHVYFPDAEAEALKGGIFADSEKVHEHNAKNLIRLLTRLLFVWFIKEKHLIPDELFKENWLKNQLKHFNPQATTLATQGNESHYYRAVLQNLFFATLNQTRGKREFRKDGQHRNITNLLRYKNYFNDPDAFVKLLEAVVPFMNGGLFECLDKVVPDKKGKQGGDVIAYEDGFSDRADNILKVPDFIFFGTHKQVDLSAELGNKSKSVEIKGLIDLLQSYKFTISENTPIEEDIALDPELLGQVFENLLASYNPETGVTARKQTGSFYTPREIVNYMIDESLLAYFGGQALPDGQAELDLPRDGGQALPDGQAKLDLLRDLLSYNSTGNPFNPAATQVLIHAIDNCKILDPACGSGAFPMGILHKLVHCLHKLDPDNKQWQAVQRAKILHDTQTAMSIEDNKELSDKLKEINNAFDSAVNHPDYARKLFLIENCIYGIDIQAIAIQISKLRFFISLVVDQIVNSDKDNFGILPLPNLETKFVAANTLIGIEKPKAQRSLFDNTDIEALENELKDVRHRLFSAKTPRTKRELRAKDEALREQIGALLIQDGWQAGTASQLAGWSPYDQNASSGFFDSEWMFGFKHFDIVIGNPPYVQVKKGIFSESQFPYSEGKDKGKQNLYKVFTEQSFNLIKNGGVASLIVQSSLMADVSSQYTRELLLTKTKISFFIEFPKKSSNADGQVFENVLQGTCVYLFRKEQPDEKTSFNVSINNDVTTINDLIFDSLNQSELIKIYPNGFFIPLVMPNEFNLAQNVFNKSKPLSEFITGIKKGDISSDTDKKLFFEKVEGYKLIRGNNIQRYFCKSGFDFVQINDKTELMKKKNHEQSIIAFQNITGTVDLHRIHSCLFEKQDDLIFLDTTIKVYVKENANSKFLLACINSSLMDWYFRKTSTNNHVNGYEIKELPIPKIPPNQQQPFIDLVDKILAAKQSGGQALPDCQAKPDLHAWEREIDSLVYALYGLTDAEIAIVEGRSGSA